MISGVEGRLPYMTYPEPWRGPPKQLPELFLRPAPKPPTGYNGLNETTINGSRSVGTKFPPQAPINLVYGKNETTEEMAYNSRILSHSSQLTHFPYLYQQQPYMMRPSFPPTPTISPLEPFAVTSPLTSNSSVSTFLSPPLSSTFSPPATVGLGKSALNVVVGHDNKRGLPQSPLPPPPNSPSQHQAFKIPCGKEGSLKHRILTRPEDGVRNVPLDLQKSTVEPRKRLQATLSPTSPTPPRSPKKIVNNIGVMSSFTKGSLIQLVNGDLKKIEDMKTEDFISSAEKSLELRLAQSTVVKIEENRQTGNAVITLKYNKMNAQAEIESSLEHPYFVIGQGWASCNPERTQICYNLVVYRLQVGDVIISLTPREKSTQSSSFPSRLSSTVITTATSTTMTSKQISVNNNVAFMSEQQHHQPHKSTTTSATNYTQHNIADSLQQQIISAETLAARKRRWSAPDQICDDNNEQIIHKRRVE